MRYLQLLCLTLALYLSAPLALAQAHMPQISVTGNAEINAKPDMATIRLTLRTSAPQSATAKEQSDQRLNSFLDRLEMLGIDDEHIKAANLNINAQYDYQNRQQRFIGFQASRDISIKVSDLGMLHPVLDAAVEERINDIGGIQYQSSKEDELRQQARHAAIADSKQKAKELATAYDAQLGPVYQINYHAGRVSLPMARNESVALMAADASESSGRFIPGDITIKDRISVVFDLITN